MKKIFPLCLLIALLMFLGCKKPMLQPSQKDLAGETAKQYYEYLKEGNFEAFVDGTYREKVLRPRFREEFIENAKMFKQQLDSKHGGVKDIDVKTVAVDTTLHVASVYLNLSYDDGNAETILVPMVEKDELWYMR